MKRPSWSTAARRDLDDKIDWLASFDVAAASRIADTIEDRAIWLASNTRAGQRIDGVAARLFHVLSTRFVLVYRLAGDTIEILRLFHDAQDWR